MSNFSVHSMKGSIFTAPKPLQPFSHRKKTILTTVIVSGAYALSSNVLPFPHLYFCKSRMFSRHFLSNSLYSPQLTYYFTCDLTSLSFSLKLGRPAIP